MEHIYTSKFANIQLVLTGWDEPNNGRMLQVADLYINDEVQNEAYFAGWNRLDQNLQNYQMEATNGSFVYIPQEGGGFLIRIENLEKIELPYKGLSTLTFMKNEFIADKLYLTHSDETIIFDLHSFEETRIPR